MTKKKRKQETLQMLRGYPTLFEAIAISNEAAKRLSEHLYLLSEVIRKNDN